nr:hypothetical protein [Tanacetum cinerariifolium]
MMGAHGFHYCLSVLGGDTCEGYIFIFAWVFLEGTPMMGAHGFHYCLSVLGGDTYDGHLVHRFHELRDGNMEGASWTVSLVLGAGGITLSNPDITHRDNSQNKVCFGEGGSGGGLDDEDKSDLMIGPGINTHQHCSQYEACYVPM